MTEEIDEAFKTIAVTCSISAAVLYFCVAGLICGMGASGARNHIHWNVCVCLIVSNVLLLVGSERVPGSIDCTAVSIATQFFNLASQSWLATETMHLFRISASGNTVSDKNSRKCSGNMDDHVGPCSGEGLPQDHQSDNLTKSPSARVSHYYIMGWIVPGVYVATTAPAAIETLGKSYNCWIATEDRVIWIFIAPSAAIFAFHCVVSFLTIRRTAVALKFPVTESSNLRATEQAMPVFRESASAESNRSGHGIVFIHPPIYDVTEKRLVVTLPDSQAMKENSLQITRWNVSLLPIVTATWCFWILSIRVRLVVSLYLTCAMTAGQVFYAFLYFCVISFRLERRKRVLKKRKINAQARPVTVMFGDDEVKTSQVKPNRIQNMELMLRTPTPFPDSSPLRLLQSAGSYTSRNHSVTQTANDKAVAQLESCASLARLIPEQRSRLPSIDIDLGTLSLSSNLHSTEIQNTDRPTIHLPFSIP